MVKNMSNELIKPDDNLEWNRITMDMSTWPPPGLWIILKREDELIRCARIGDELFIPFHPNAPRNSILYMTMPITYEWRLQDVK